MTEVNVMFQNNLMPCVTKPNKAKKKHTSNFFFLSVVVCFYSPAFSPWFFSHNSWNYFAESWIYNPHRGDTQTLSHFCKARSTFTVLILLLFLCVYVCACVMSHGVSDLKTMWLDDLWWLALILLLCNALRWINEKKATTFIFLSTFHTGLFRLSS